MKKFTTFDVTKYLFKVFFVVEATFIIVGVYALVLSILSMVKYPYPFFNTIVSLGAGLYMITFIVQPTVSRCVKRLRSIPEAPGMKLFQFNDQDLKVLKFAIVKTADFVNEDSRLTEDQRTLVMKELYEVNEKLFKYDTDTEKHSSKV